MSPQKSGAPARLANSRGVAIAADAHSTSSMHTGLNILATSSIPREEYRSEANNCLAV